MLNVFLIEQIESLPDTTITLTSGKKLVVQESADEVERGIVLFLKQIPLTATIRTEEGVVGCLKAKE